MEQQLHAVTAYPYGETVTLVSRAKIGTDSDGNDVYTNTRTDVPRVPVWPRDGNGTSGNERTNAKDQVIVGYVAVLPAGTDVTAFDAVEWRGVTYEVEGEPGIFKSPFTGWEPGVVVALKRVTG